MRIKNNKFVKWSVVGFVIALCLLLGTWIDKIEDKKIIETMSNYKPMIEKAYDENKLEGKKEIDSGVFFSFNFFSDKNSLVYESNPARAKGKQTATFTMTVNKVGDKFVWTCIKKEWLVTKECEKE